MEVTIRQTATSTDWARAPRGGVRGPTSPVYPATLQAAPSAGSVRRVPPCPGSPYTVGNDPGICAFGCVRIGTYRQAKQTNPRNHATADADNKERAPGPTVAATRQIAATVINTYAAVSTG
jgi:hypothetical protein